MNSSTHYKVKNIMEGIFWFNFKRQRALCSAFMRYQEHFESPKFRNTMFTRKEFAKWYAKMNHKFTYFEDIVGFNVPYSSVEVFRHTDMRLTDNENIILNHTKDLKKPYYLIGTYGSDSSAEKHEIAHALYYMYPEYTEKALRIVAKASGLEEAFKQLKKRGYHPSTWMDEIHAFTLEPFDDISGKDIAVGDRYTRGALTRLFNSYVKPKKGRKR